MTDNPWKRKQIDTDHEGYTLPDGRRYTWAESRVVLKVEAEIIPPEGGPLMLGRKFEGEDALVVLLELLDQTA